MKIKKILLIGIMTVMLFELTGCAKKDTTNNLENDPSVEQSTTTQDDVVGVEINNATSDFDEKGYMELMGKEGNTNFTVDTEGNILYRYKRTSKVQGYLDGYAIFKEDDDFVVRNQFGEEKFRILQDTTKEFDLHDNGTLTVHTVETTYNSSTEKWGVYNLEFGKYVIDLSEDNVKKYSYCSDGFYMISSSYPGRYINANKENSPEFSFSGNTAEPSVTDIHDGYYIENTRLTDVKGIDVYDFNNASFYTIKSPWQGDNEDHGIEDGVGWNDEMAFGSREATIYNLKTKNAISMRDQFYAINTYDDLTYSGDYLLVPFRNPNFNSYYVVIDKEGNFMFDPVNCDDIELADDNKISKGYFAIKDNGEGLSEIRNYKNEIVVTGIESEQFFQGMTDKFVKVAYRPKGRADSYYYRNAETGKILTIKE